MNESQALQATQAPGTFLVENPRRGVLTIEMSNLAARLRRTAKLHGNVAHVQTTGSGSLIVIVRKAK